MLTASQFSGYIGDFATLRGVLVGLTDVRAMNKSPTRELVDQVTLVSSRLFMPVRKEKKGNAKWHGSITKLEA